MSVNHMADQSIVLLPYAMVYKQFQSVHN